MLVRCLWRRPFQPGPGNSFPAVAGSGVQHILLWFPSTLAYTLSIIPSLNSPPSSSLRALFPPCLRAGAPSSFHVPSLLSPFSLSPSLLPSLTPAPHSSVSSSFLLLLLELGDRRICRLAYQAPHLVCGCPRPWVVKNTVFLSALLRILAGFQSVQPIAQPLSNPTELTALSYAFFL